MSAPALSPKLSNPRSAASAYSKASGSASGNEKGDGQIEPGLGGAIKIARILLELDRLR